MEEVRPWQPAAELFPTLAIGDWFEMEGAPRYRFCKRTRTEADRWNALDGSWVWGGITAMGRQYVSHGDEECRILRAKRPVKN